MTDAIETFYPTLEEVLFLHERLLERFGGTPGVRDLGLVESALYRPRSGYYESLSLQASALLHSLVMNHGFVDGNKRVAFATAAIFLATNGYELVVDADRAEEFLITRVIQGRAELDEISGWLESVMRPL